jgi:hypothetical protein
MFDFHLDWTVVLLVVVVFQLFCIARTLAAIFAALMRLYRQLDPVKFKQAEVEPWERKRADSALSATEL